MITAETTTESIRNVSRFLFFVIMSRKWYLIIFFFASFTAFSQQRPPHVQVVEPVVVPPVLVKPVSGMVSPASALTAQSSVAVGSPSASPEIALANGFKDLGAASSFPRMGFYNWGYHTTISTSVDDDKEPDIYYLTLNGATYRFTFDRQGKARFQPQADISVEVTYQPLTDYPTVGRFTNWKVTLPNGTRAYFNQQNVEQSMEVEIKTAQANGIVPTQPNFNRYRKHENVTSAWYLAKLEDPQGQSIDLTYKTALYSYFKVADNEATGWCAPPTSVAKTLNKVYVQSSVLSSISGRTAVVKFNDLYESCSFYEPIELEICAFTLPPRLDIDSWLASPFNQSNAKQLGKIRVFEKNASEPTFTFGLDYDYFLSNPENLPQNYTAAEVGTTHLKRLKLKKVTMADSTTYDFDYLNENFPLPSRLTYGVDHWGFFNGASGNLNLTGLIGSDAVMSATCGKASNREADFVRGQLGLLARITASSGAVSTLTYEPHQTSNFSGQVGGARLASIRSLDRTTGLSTNKTYSYLSTDGGSSGHLFLKPIYRFYNQTGSAAFSNSGLYAFLQADLCVPTVGYSRVTETLTDSLGAALGSTVYRFNQNTDHVYGIASTQYSCNEDGCTAYDYYWPYTPQHTYTDHTAGSLASMATYDQNGRMRTETRHRYVQSNITYDTVKRIVKFNGQTLGFNQTYGLAFNRFRIEATDNIDYGQTGNGTPVATATTYRYKNQMPAPYQQAYAGTHELPVQTTESASGITMTQRVVADFDFGKDSTLVDLLCWDEVADDFYVCGSRYETTENIPPASSAARVLYDLKARHQLYAPLESQTERSGHTVGASQLSYYNNGLLKATFSLENTPTTGFSPLFYDRNLNELVANDNYGPPRQEILIYNLLGQPTLTRSRFGTSALASYAPDGLPISTTANAATSNEHSVYYQYENRLFGASQQTAPNGLSVGTRFYANGRPKAQIDGQGFLITHYAYATKDQLLLGIGSGLQTDINKNRVVVFQPRNPTPEGTPLPPDATTTIDYLDASGQRLQQVAVGSSPTAKDLVGAAATYDTYGRTRRQFLPVATPNASTGSFVSSAQVLALGQGFYNDAAPFGQVLAYEAAPSSQATASQSAGAAQQNAPAPQSTYATWADGVLRKYSFDTATGQVSHGGYWPVGAGFVHTSSDERGHRQLTYRDAAGKTIATSTQASGDGNNPTNDYLTTHYVYDDFERLAFVLPPSFVATGGGFGVNDATFSNHIYGFVYDGRGRVVAKHVPNGGWSYHVYNRLDQLVLTQNASQRASNLWQFDQYDGHGRSVRSGTLTTTRSHAQLQADFATYDAPQQFESPLTPSGGTGRYGSQSFPAQIALQESDVQAEYFYDDYTWNTDANFDFQTYQTPRYSNATGLATGSRVRRLDTGEWLQSVVYYDDKNRVIQTLSRNRFGGINQRDVTYNFVGEVLQTRSQYRKPNQPNVEIKNAYTRDHAGRVTRLTQTLNGKSTVLADYNFDEIGRLKQKKILPQGFAFPDYITRQSPSPQTPRGGFDVASKAVTLLPGFLTTPNQTYAACIANGLIMGPIQTVDYAYHISGGLKAINLPPTPEGGLNNTENDLFGLKLEREEDGRYYNGLISKQSWLSKPNNQSRSFTYSYDQADRFASAAYAGKEGENYTVNSLSYDPNGNIQTLQRSGLNTSNSWGLIDNLSYDYSNKINQLANITDASNTTKGFQSIGGGGYSYYLDGSLKSDANRGITNIVYNYLGLVEEIQLNTNGRKIIYTYTADGQKLRKTIKETGKADFVVDYMGELIYHQSDGSDGKLVSINTDEGRAVPLDSTNQDFTYQFFYNDHLGNLRVTYSVAPNGAYITQENHFGPTGELLEGISTNSETYPYLFQGKEREFAWGLGFDDFETRTYYPFTGRMWQIDGADQFASGYVGMGNNAVNGVDPDGQWVHIAIGAAVGGLVNLGTKLYQGKIRNFKDGAVAFGIGAVAGGITAATGGAGAVYASTGSFAGAFSATAVAASSTGFLGGAIAGTIGSAFGSGVQGIGNAAYFGDPYSARQYGRDVLFGGIFGGIGGGIAAWAQGVSPWKMPNWGQKWVKTNAGWKLSGVKSDPVTFNSVELPDGTVSSQFAGMNGTSLGGQQTVKTSTNAFKHSFKYADRVRMRAVQDPVSHNFSYSFDDAILSTGPILKNNGYKIFQQAGAMNGKNGVFEIGLTKGGIIDHRFFRPTK